jgi:hypothetical protein
VCGDGRTRAGPTLGRLAGRFETAWSEGLDDLPLDALRAHDRLIAERPGDHHLDLAWVDGREANHRDVEVAVELLCDHVSEALDRIERAPAEKPTQNVLRFKR